MYDELTRLKTLYFNHASRTPLLCSAKEMLLTYLNQWEDGTHTPYEFNFEKKDLFKEHIATLLTTRSDQIMITQSVADAMTIFIQGLSFVIVSERASSNGRYYAFHLREM